MIVLDTTVLVYAVGTDDPLRSPCVQLLEAVASQRIEATTTVEVIQEFCHVRARRRGREDAVRLARDFAYALSPLLSVDEARLAAALDLFATTPPLSSDAVLATVTLDVGAEALVSADRSFAAVAGLRHVLPDEAGIAALLER